MFTVHKRDVGLLEGQPELITEASTLGLPPGNWPDFISVVDDSNSGFLFQKGNVIRADGGDFGGFRYYTRDGRFALSVFND